VPRCIVFFCSTHPFPSYFPVLRGRVAPLCLFLTNFFKNGIRNVPRFRRFSFPLKHVVLQTDRSFAVPFSSPLEDGEAGFDFWFPWSFFIAFPLFVIQVALADLTRFVLDGVFFLFFYDLPRFPRKEKGLGSVLPSIWSSPGSCLVTFSLARAGVVVFFSKGVCEWCSP